MGDVGAHFGIVESIVLLRFWVSQLRSVSVGFSHKTADSVRVYIRTNLQFVKLLPQQEADEACCKNLFFT